MRAPITDKHLLEMMWERFPEIMKRGAEQQGQCLSKEALKLALEALENSYDYVAEEADRVERMYGNYPTRQGKVKGLRQDERKHMEAITAIKQALAAPVQEPVAHDEDWLEQMYWEFDSERKKSGEERLRFKGFMRAYGTRFANTTPPAAQRQWVGLTDEQILHFVGTHVGGPNPSYPLDNSDWLHFARAIEAAHGIKENK